MSCFCFGPGHGRGKVQGRSHAINACVTTEQRPSSWSHKPLDPARVLQRTAHTRRDRVTVSKTSSALPTRSMSRDSHFTPTIDILSVFHPRPPVSRHRNMDTIYLIITEPGDKISKRRGHGRTIHSKLQHILYTPISHPYPPLIKEKTLPLTRTPKIPTLRDLCKYLFLVYFSIYLCFFFPSLGTLFPSALLSAPFLVFFPSLYRRFATNSPLYYFPGFLRRSCIAR